MVHTQENKTGVFLNNSFSETIRDKFQKINSVEEFVSLLNFIDININDPKEQIYLITIQHLYHLSKSKNNRYNSFQISKKNGKMREINSPDNLLKRVQSLINILLQIVFEPYSHQCSNGFLIGKDIIKNAIPHINKRFVLNIDIKDFFPSINFRRIKVVLGLAPFRLNGNKDKIGFLIANLATYNNFLPQGAPTSPILSNVVTQNLDRKIAKICLPKKIKYTRYADDLSFSSNREIFDSAFIESIKKILLEENFIINVEKTRIRNNMECQEVTGIVVNKKVNTKREYLQKVRAMLNNWEKGGLKFAENEFKYHQPLHKIDYKFKSVLLGHLSFLKLVKGEDNKVINNLRLKYIFLSNLIDYNFVDHEAVQKKLKKDNINMETIFFGNIEPNDKFISFCTSAFHQIENLINYYYWKKFPNYDDLLNELLTHNIRFKKSYKNLETARNNFKKISNLNINVLVFLYEKEFFFDKKKYYNKHITMLREIRNDDSHRCSIIDIDIEKLKHRFTLLEAELNKKKKAGKNIELTPDQRKIELDYKTFIFLEQKKYKEVRQNLSTIANNINLNFAKQLKFSCVNAISVENEPDCTDIS